MNEGICRGLLWPENEEIIVRSINDLEAFYSSRLGGEKSQSHFEFQVLPFVLCHLDLAPKNIIHLSDGSLCLLDWASAGFYPRLFETCGQRVIAGFDGHYNQALLHNMVPSTVLEEHQAELMLRAFYNMQRFNLYGSQP